MRKSTATRTVDITTALEQFAQLLNQVYRRDDRVIIEKHGIPVAAIISAEDYRRLVECESQQADDFAYFEEIRTRFDDVPLDEHERGVAQSVKAARRALRAERESESTTSNPE